MAAYYIVSEALANAAKHARASVVDLRVDRADEARTLSIRDDGIGGADPSHGSESLASRTGSTHSAEQSRSPARLE